MKAGTSVGLSVAAAAVAWLSATALVASPAPSRTTRPAIAIGALQRAPQQASTASQPATPSAPGGGFVGEDTCLTCHVDQAAIKKTGHGRAADPRAPAAQRSCESCHGPGQAHVEDENKGHIRKFAQLAPRDASETCLSCHTRGAHALWEGSTHDTRNLSCTTCHSVHKPQSVRAQLKADSQTALCSTCHKQQALKIQRVSHMPVREGRMECTSCHNPHGTTNVRLLKTGNWINEGCFSCHTEKRGPFLYEHAAGRESCVSCHDPHGSSNERMLVAKLPMLCQRCHIGTRHPSTIYDAAQLASRSNRLVGRGCVNCHSQVHGTNHPSGGTFLR